MQLFVIVVVSLLPAVLAVWVAIHFGSRLPSLRPQYFAHADHAFSYLWLLDRLHIVHSRMEASHSLDYAIDMVVTQYVLGLDPPDQEVDHLVADASCYIYSAIWQANRSRCRHRHWLWAGGTQYNWVNQNLNSVEAVERAIQYVQDLQAMATKRTTSSEAA